MLVHLTLSEIANICDGEWFGHDSIITSIKTDSRDKLEGALFLALTGDAFDGHDYIEMALNKGAIAVLVEKETEALPVVKVKDTLHAYGKIANHLRNNFAGKVIAVTGSNGKTTVKEWLSQCLETQFSVLKTQKNNNNQIGVPLTLCGLEPLHQFAVIEAGTSYVGEIPKLAEIIEPDVAIITNASGSHLSGFGSLEGIAIEKGALLSGLSENGVAVINYEDAWFDYWCSLVTGRKIISFGFSNAADMFASDIKLHKSGSSCVIQYQQKKVALKLATPGVHQISNAMAVLITLLECGFSIEEGAEALSAPLNISGRLEFSQASNGFLVLNDCYNASPTSVEAAIDVLSYQDEASKWLVLGALKELGDSEYDVHKSLGEYAYHAGIHHLLCVGPVAAIAAQSFCKLGGHAQVCSDHSDAVEILQKLDENNAILVKGARSSKMEKIIEKLVN